MFGLEEIKFTNSGRGRYSVFRISAAAFGTPALKAERNLYECCPLIPAEADHGCWQHSRFAQLGSPLGFSGLPQCWLDPLTFSEHELSPMSTKKR